MKQIIKRAVALAMAVCMMMSLICFDASAAGSSFSNAKSISTGTYYTDYLASSSEVDYYKFTLSSAGYITVNFKHEYVDSGSIYWEAYLYNSDYDEITQLGRYNGNTGSTKTSAKIGLPAGTYYIKVDNYNYDNADYSIKVNYTASSEWETEFNDSFSTADKIKINTTARGSLMNSNDVDYYKVVLSEKGYISLAFTHGYVDSGSIYWEAYLYNSDYDEITQLGRYNGNTESTKTSTKIGLPAGTYYIKVNNYNVSSSPYALRVKFTASTEWETETNDSFATADVIKTNRTVNGSLMNVNDADYYKVTVPKTQTFTLLFEHGYVDSHSAYWTVSIYDKNCDSLDMSYKIAGDDTTTSISGIKLKAGTYYIKVENYNRSDVPYSLCLKTYLKSPHTSSIANSTSGINVKWEKVSGVDGYKVYRKAGSGDWKLIKTIADPTVTSYTDKNCTNGTKYSYRIKSYIDDNGVIVTSSYYKTLYTYCLTRPTISSATNSGTKAVTVKWDKNSAATGYQVKYTVGDTTKTVSTTNLSKTISSLTKGNTYKFYVRAYKKVGDVTYCSAYSVYKSVKVTK